MKVAVSVIRKKYVVAGLNAMNTPDLLDLVLTSRCDVISIELVPDEIGECKLKLKHCTEYISVNSLIDTLAETLIKHGVA